MCVCDYKRLRLFVVCRRLLFKLCIGFPSGWLAGEYVRELAAKNDLIYGELKSAKKSSVSICRVCNIMRSGSCARLDLT